jgi:hypothetical protein
MYQPLGLATCYWEDIRLAELCYGGHMPGVRGKEENKYRVRNCASTIAVMLHLRRRWDNRHMYHSGAPALHLICQSITVTAVVKLAITMTSEVVNI